MENMQNTQNVKFCQSCGMPMGPGAAYGTEADGSPSTDYCAYCYEKGAFTAPVDLKGMIDICVGPMVEANPGMAEAQARDAMAHFLPMLKRWK